MDIKLNLGKFMSQNLRFLKQMANKESYIHKRLV